MTLPDARTLNDVAYPFEIESIEPFLLEVDAVSNEADDINVPIGNTVDLRPLVQELILLHVPVQVHGDDEENQLVEGKAGRFFLKKIQRKPNQNRSATRGSRSVL